MAKQTPQEKRKQALIDELLADYDGPESFWGESGLFADLKRRIVERTLDAEMDDHLGYRKHDPKGNNSGNYTPTHCQDQYFLCLRCKL